MRPLSRVYFAIASNPGEQFYAFAALSCWLLKLAGRQVEMPQEDDDPNATVATILENCRQLVINYYNICFWFSFLFLKIEAFFILGLLCRFSAFKIEEWLWR